MTQRVHQFTTSGWFLLVTTFVLGYGIGRYHFQIEALINALVTLLSGVPFYCGSYAPC